MDKKKSWLEKLSDFVAGKGFYVVVLACVAAIGLSGYYLYQGVRETFSGDNGGDAPAGGPAGIVVSSQPTSKPSQAPKPTYTPKPKATAKPSPTPKVTAKPAPSPTAKPKQTAAPKQSAAPVASAKPVETPVPTPAPTATPKPVNLVFTWPVNGGIAAAFSVENLAYDETMGDWRTHEGIDIRAPIGTRVLATAAGTVSAFYSDDLLGNTLEIDHGNGLVSVYSNLSDSQIFQVGDAVETGTVIGTVGSSATGESKRESHLHFALYKEDKPVDPLEYLPQT